MAGEPYEIGSRVQRAHTCCGGVPGTVESCELIRRAREWNPDDHDRYRYAVRWDNYPDGVFMLTSSDLEPWRNDN
jgi:hypothetical protein